MTMTREEVEEKLIKEKRHDLEEEMAISLEEKIDAFTDQLLEKTDDELIALADRLSDVQFKDDDDAVVFRTKD